GENSNAHALAGAGRQDHRTTDELVGFLGVDAELDSDVDGLIELRGGGFLDQGQGFRDGVELRAIDLGGNCGRALGQFSHAYTPSTVMPMLRALPAMVRTAASRSAAVRSGVLVLAISSAWARVSVPTLSRLGLAEPFCTPLAFLIRMVAGGVFMMKVKLLSAYAVITTGIGRPGSMPCV